MTCDTIGGAATGRSAMNVGPEFLRAGHAVFTVANPSGEHYTYRLASPPERVSQAEFAFASLLTGPDNECDYTYLGCYHPSRAEVRLTNASRFAADSKPVRVLRWAVEVVHGRKPLPAGYAIRHEGRCGRCGRALTEPRSLECGIGPECRRKMEMFAAD